VRDHRGVGAAVQCEQVPWTAAMWGEEVRRYRLSQNLPLSVTVPEHSRCPKMEQVALTLTR
jgi:hypothetical protein